MPRYTTATLLVGLLASLGVACSPSEKAEAPQTYAEAQALAAQTHKPLLVDFYATW